MKHFLLLSLALLLLRSISCAQNASPSPSSSPAAEPSPGAVAQADSVVVQSEQLDISRENIVPSLGATRYTLGPDWLGDQAQGENAPINQTILRLPGAAQDSYGQIHLRGEHANLQYRIDDVLLPEGITGFGQELSTRFADSISLITGALPAQFGFRTTGVIDLHTKNGAAFDQGEASLYVGSFDTIMPSLEYGGSTGKLNYYATTSYLHSGIGVENPTRSSDPIHDNTDQYKVFADLSYIFDENSRLVLLVSGNTSDFQIPNNPGQTPMFVDNGRATFDSSRLNENQHEQSAFLILAYQRKVGDLDLEASVFTRYSSVLFRPDDVGDLIFNGVASRIDREIYSNGVELNASYKLTDDHTLRGGLLFTAQHANVDTSTLVLSTFPDGTQSSDAPLRIVDQGSKDGFFYGLYLQDEWKPFQELTINFGGRLDFVNAFTDENQLSPRLNIVYEPLPGTAFHAGYARYFTPPPLENVDQNTLAKFIGTTNAAAVTKDSAVSVERANYFDLGVTQKLGDSFNVGLDGYYKTAHSALDEGQFGQALILSAFNYNRSEIYGTELTGNYEKGGFNAYFNLAYEVARGKQVSSAQFLFSPEELAYINRNWVFLDHDQRFTSSAGASYTWRDWTGAIDALYGNGLRRGFANTEKLPPYETINLSLQRRFKISDE
nr:TonB-dependent receptor [Verrucomicrobiota bacterium]